MAIGTDTKKGTIFLFYEYLYEPVPVVGSYKVRNIE